MSSFAPFLRPALCAGLLLACACGSQAAGAALAGAGASAASVVPPLPALRGTIAMTAPAAAASAPPDRTAPAASAGVSAPRRAVEASDASPDRRSAPAAAAASAVAAASGPAHASATLPLELGPPDLRQRIAERLAAMRAARAAARRGAVAEAAPSHAETPSREATSTHGEPVARAPEGARQVAEAPARARATPSEVVPASQSAARGQRQAAAATAGPSAPARRAARASAATTRRSGEPDWSYDGPTGPEAWATLDPAYAGCRSGRRQSPIDIRDGISVDLQPLGFDYRPGAFSVLDDGHTVRVDVAAGSTLAVGGRRYMLRQFHFHRPSEERLDGRGYPMSAHLVHADADGRLAVVAVLIDSGKAHPLVQQVWNDLPLERHAPQSGAGPLDPAALLPEDRRYATFMGSLTTPPCTEGVLWIVLRQPATMSPEQMAIFAKLYPMNARPMQAASGRLIKQSN
jgi:carbonic anhydrase